MSVFIVLMFILILQAIWLYIKELAGRDLDLITIAKFMAYNIPVVVPLALPLSVLLASIMVFGNLAENYEFAAMKSNGISLQRAMRSLIILIAGIGVVSFLFANSVIPWGHFKQKNLRVNISKKKPAMAISEGVFNQIGDVNIKVEKKSGDRGQYLTDVIIHKKEPQKSGNYTVIKSKTGELKSSLKSNLIQLVLEDGNYYNDMYITDIKKRATSPYMKSSFSKYIFNIDVSELNKVDLESESVTDNQKMLRINELKTSLDSFAIDIREGSDFYFEAQNNKWAPGAITQKIKDDVKPVNDNTYYFLDSLNIFDQRRAVENAVNKIKGQKASLENRQLQMKSELKRMRNFELEIHKKYALGIGCIILFFIGAPLGAIIRKGGMGLPLVIATLFFLSYHFIGISAKQGASEGALPTWLGGWLSTLIIFPIGIFLTYRATTDQGIFDITGPIEKLVDRFKKKKKPQTPAST